MPMAGRLDPPRRYTGKSIYTGPVKTKRFQADRTKPKTLDQAYNELSMPRPALFFINRLPVNLL